MPTFTLNEMLSRTNHLKHLASRISLLPGRAVVAIDGVDGSGKSTFADDLAQAVTGHSSVVRASVDGFHNARCIRYLRGKGDPEGFFLDSYDYDGFRQHLLKPFRDGAPTVQTTRFDHRTDEQFITVQQVPPLAILLIDGIFLHRDELKEEWDFSVFLRVPFHVTFERMSHRDGCSPDPLAPENRRYMEGQRIYLRSCQPEQKANVIIENH